MNKKKAIFILCLLMVLLSMASVSAGDVDDMALQTSDNTAEDAIASDDGNIPDIGDNSDESNLEGAGSFKELQGLIDITYEGAELYLDEDYSLSDYDEDTLSISKSITINGNNHTLNAANYKGILRIDADGKNVILKNIIFKDVITSKNGGAIINTHSSTSLTLINCEFNNNHAECGGAVYSSGNLYVVDSKFNSNRAESDGGAIYCEGETHINGSQFKDNYANGSSSQKSFGGAVASIGECYIDSSTFDNNYADDFGGAVYANNTLTMTGHNNFTDNMAKNYGGAVFGNGNIYINWNDDPDSLCAMDSNYVTFEDSESYGGAIYVEYNLYGKFLNLTNNVAFYEGGGIFCWGETHITNSEFYNNSVQMPHLTFFGYHGGAIYSNDICYIDSCIFDSNHAPNRGGAIFVDNDIIITGQNSFSYNYLFGDYDLLITDGGGAIYSSGRVSIDHAVFIGNRVHSDGGAIFCELGCEITNSYFFQNSAYNNDSDFLKNYGGAIRSKRYISVINCTFDNNTAYNWGGAIYADDEIEIRGSSFTGNSAKDAGAVYASAINYWHGIGIVSDSVFLNNEATSGDGGAVYIFNKCDPEFVSCRFEGNTCTKRGGAIYTDSSRTHMQISYCTFIGNSANKKGQSIYNSGYYDSFDMCWFGTNNPHFKDQFKIYHAVKADEDYKPSNYLKIAMEINETDLHLNQTYKVTIYFYSTNGNSLSNDLLHSQGFFSGDGNFSNINADINDTTADVVFVKKYNFTEDYMIWGQIDNQGASLKLNVGKQQSEVEIVSCENITYSEELKVIYIITHGSPNPTYVITDILGKIIKEGNCTNSQYKTDTLTVENLTPGLYSITIYSPETETSLPSNASADFKVKSPMSVNLSADNVTYGNPTTITLKTDYDGKYNVAIGDLVLEMEAVDGICVKQVNLDAGEYQTNTSLSENNSVTDEDGRYWPWLLTAGDDVILNCSEASFSVYKASNNVEVAVENVSYGMPSIISITADADGDYLVDVNGTSYNVAVKDGVGNVSVALDAGSYYANASFDSKNYNTDYKNADFTVDKADIDLVVIVFDEVYPQDVEGIVYASVDGDYNLTIGNYEAVVSVKDNMAYFNVGTLDAGTYEATVSFEGNNNYNPASNKTSFNVTPSGTLFEIEATPSLFTYGETANVTHIISDGATGNITYYLHNGTFLGELSIDENLTLPVLDAGSYVIFANYSGDNDFYPASDAVLIGVNPALNSASVSVANVTYGEKSLINVSAEVDGIYAVDINGTLYNVTVKDGVGNVSVALDAGSYYANVSFGNGNYNTSSKNAVFTVNKAASYLNASDVVAVYNVEKDMFIYLEDAQGNPLSGFTVSVDLDGVKNYTTNKDGQIKVPTLGLDVNVYIVSITFAGSENYLGSDATVIAIIVKNTPTVAVSADDITYGGDAVIDFTLTDEDNNRFNGTLEVFVGGDSFNVTVVDGAGSLNVPDLDANNYMVAAFYPGDADYNPALGIGHFTVSKKASAIVYADMNTTAVQTGVDGRVGEYFNVTLVDADGNPLAGKAIQIGFNGKAYNRTTNETGGACLQINLPREDIYTFAICFLGDDNYIGSFEVAKITVNKQTAKLDVPNKSYRATASSKTLTATFKSSKGHAVANRKISFTVNGKTYTASTNSKGVATVKVSLNRKGTYSVVAKYAGDSTYAAISKKATLKLT